MAPGAASQWLEGLLRFSGKGGDGSNEEITAAAAPLALTGLVLGSESPALADRSHAHIALTPPKPHDETHTVTALYMKCFARPTSYPGGPRSERQQRRAQWEKREAALEPGWCFAHAEVSRCIRPCLRVGPARRAIPSHTRTHTHRRSNKFQIQQESHALTEAYYEGMLNGKIPLTGEAAGRQTWHFDQERAKKMLGKDAAKKAGEKDMSFSAARNPNAGDKVGRGVCVRVGGGGSGDVEYGWLRRSLRQAFHNIS